VNGEPLVTGSVQVGIEYLLLTKGTRKTREALNSVLIFANE
jgi:hypothetical protein